MLDSRAVVICGFGELGQTLANMLESPLAMSLERGVIPYVAFDLQPSRLRRAREAGFNVLYGDASRPAVSGTSLSYHFSSSSTVLDAACSWLCLLVFYLGGGQLLLVWGVSLLKMVSRLHGLTCSSRASPTPIRNLTGFCHAMPLVVRPIGPYSQSHRTMPSDPILRCYSLSRSPSCHIEPPEGCQSKK